MFVASHTWLSQPQNQPAITFSDPEPASPGTAQLPKPETPTRKRKPVPKPCRVERLGEA